MGARIDQFCEDLRQKLTIVDNGLDGLKTKINGKAQHAEQDVKNHLDRVHDRVEQGRARLAAARADVKDWAEEKKTATGEKIAEWKTKRELSRLQDRADKAERYAAAASAIATAALDEAEEASLEAWLARQDAISAQAN